MKYLTRLNLFGIRPTRENLYIALTLIVPLVLLIFLSVESLFILVMLALFYVTIAVFHIKKDRDYCRHSWELCKKLLEEEKNKNKQMINCEKSTQTSEVIASM